MEYNHIKHQLEEGVKIIILNRPDVFNSFNLAMSNELIKILTLSGEDENVRAILITGEGKAFSAGQDLSEIITADGEIKGPGELIREIYNPIIRFIRNIEKPVVCAVNGVAAGAGANIALSCDIVVASEQASFVQAFTKIGLIPDSGGTFFLPRLVGFQRASAYMMLNEKINAKEAFEMGMVYKIFTHSLLNEESLKISKRLAEMPSRSLALLKKALNESYHNDLESQLSLELKLQEQCGQSSDYKEGVRAFIEKRKAVFTGK